jgi:LPS O-antigen subunit length determinant protein (WzzB/FepE family)
MKEKKKDIAKDEIDIISLIKEFWEQRKLILKITAVFGCIGLFIAIFSKNEYTSSTTFLPVTGKSVSSSNLDGWASLAGINLGGSANASGVSKELYPQIVSSVPFLKELLNTKLSIIGQDSLVTYKEYYKNIYTPGVLSFVRKYTLGLPGLLIGVFKSDPKKLNKYAIEVRSSIISISKEDDALIKQLESQIHLSLNNTGGFVSIDVRFPEPKASAQLTKRVEKLLQSFILEFKKKKSLEELEFVEKRYLEKEKEFNTARIKLARFQDQNIGVNTALGTSRLFELQEDYNLMFSLYSELAKQVETQRLQLKKDTPVFSVLKPVVVPNYKSGPKRLLILITYLFLGLLLSLGFVLGRKTIKVLRNNSFSKD